jgi:hypothetical protein
MRQEGASGLFQQVCGSLSEILPSSALTVGRSVTSRCTSLVLGRSGLIGVGFFPCRELQAGGGCSGLACRSWSPLKRRLPNRYIRVHVLQHGPCCGCLSVFTLGRRKPRDG